MFEFRDRLGNNEILEVHTGDSVARVLLRAYIPPASVVVLKDGLPIPDTHRVFPNEHYVASLIEGYDINKIRSIYTALNDDGHKSQMAAYAFRRLYLTPNGEVNIEHIDMTLSELEEYVKKVILETCQEFSLIQEGDIILLGLSGGVDSSSLALALASTREVLPNYRLVAVTFEDFDSQHSSMLTKAAKLASDLEIEYHIIPSSLAENIFHLNTPLNQILKALMETEYAHHVMYIDHHTTRRTLEVFAEKMGIRKICLGLHSTDLIAGLLNGWLTGYDVSSIPLREVGTFTYLYPLSFLSKRELHLYYLKQLRHMASHTSPNPWERDPLDRNLYYYLSDLIQEFWPGIEVQLFTAHKWRLRRHSKLQYEQCPNCGSFLLHHPFTNINNPECDACTVFRLSGYIT